MDATPSFISLLENLNISTSLQDDLHSLKIKANSININSLRDVTKPDQMEVLFKCLNTQNSDQISVTCDVLERLLMAVDGHHLYECYAEQFSLGLKHPSIRVKILCLNNLGRAVTSNPESVIHNIDLLKSIISCICDDELSIAREAKSIIIILAKMSRFTNLLFSNNIQSHMYVCMQKSSTVSYRFYELLIEISHMDARSRDAILRSPESLLRGLKKDIEQDEDILVMLNCVELYAILSEVDDGYEFLLAEGIISIMENKLSICEQEQSGLLLPDIMKFFGNLGNRLPSRLIREYPRVIEIISRISLEDSSTDTNENALIQTLAIETIGCIGRSVQGKRELSDTMLQKLCKKISTLLVSDPEPKRRVRLLMALNNIFMCDEETEVKDTSLSEMLKQLYSATSPNQSSLAYYLQSIVAQPFVEQHEQVLILMSKLSMYEWGRQSLMNVIGWQEFLFNRKTEYEKRGKELKFNIIETLIKSNIGDLEASFVTKLRGYAADGAFFIVPEVSVQTESA